IDLIRRLKERVITENGRILFFNNVVDLADSFGGDILDLLDMLRNELETMGVDVPPLYEAPGLLCAAARVVLIDQTTLVVHKAVEVAAGAGPALAGGVCGRHPKEPPP